MKRVADIRKLLLDKFDREEFVIDKTGVKTVEIIGESFIADENWLLKTPNEEYIERELEWYLSKSLNVRDIPGGTPLIWEQVSDPDGYINSNYGFLIWSTANGNQYDNVLAELKAHPNSRRAVMIYNRPSMHTDYADNGMSDFICTYANSFLIRDGKLVSHYLMRSNDAVFGYGNDVAWAKYVQSKLAFDLGVEPGDLIWTATSLHVYERHFKFFENIR